MKRVKDSKGSETALTILIKNAKGIQGDHSIAVMVSQCGGGCNGWCRIQALLKYVSQGFGTIDTRTVEGRSVEVFALLKALRDANKLPLVGNTAFSFTQKRLRQVEGLEVLVTSKEKLSGEQLMQFILEKAPSGTEQKPSPLPELWWVQS